MDSGDQEVHPDTSLSNRPLEQIFHSAAARIVDFFILNDEFDYAESDVAKRTGLSNKTITREMPTLIDAGIVRFSRKSVRSDMYKLNRDAKGVRGLQLFVNDMLDSRFEHFAKANHVPEDRQQSADHEQSQIN